ncbi:MAG: 1-(5-phosphoribosyl)-5-((5-phosphoribosylamino)methylideneamino)imidazole-4-carboxamide isomerase, partial [Aquificota bacterium]
MTLKEFIIPAVDIKNGKAVRLYKGDPNAVKIYGENPVNVAKLWEEKGAKHLHIVDLDGAF